MRVVRDSCLVQFLVKELYQTSFTEMSKRGQYYATVLHVARLLCVPELAGALAAKPVARAAPVAGSRAADGSVGASDRAADSLAAVLDRAAAQARSRLPAPTPRARSGKKCCSWAARPG